MNKTIYGSISSLLFALLLLTGAFTVSVRAGQPNGIVLNRNGVSKIYPYFRTSGWTITQPVPGEPRITHFGDDYFAQDWARGCGTTHGQAIYAPISGKLVVYGEQSGYGNTFVIYDAESGFAFRGAHMSAGAPGLRLNDQVVAGKTLVGFVGNTGFHANSTCTSNPGSHFHGALYKNVNNPSARPVTSVSFSGGATRYAADYVFASSVPFVKGNQSSTIYALFSGGYRVPVSSFVFENHGWNFTTNRTYLNVVQTLPQSQINAMYLSSLFFPPRDGTLVRGDANPTVYYIENGERRGVTGEIFNCRGFSYSDVRTVSQGEVNRYPPNGNPPLLTGCTTGGKTGGSTDPKPSFALGAAAQSDAPSSLTRAVEVWWAVDGAFISGTQSFKAFVPNLPLTDYSMSWAVDDGLPVLMFDDLRDYPHKEAQVDVSGWTWRGAGPYRVKFTARDPNGDVIAERTVSIFVQ